MTKTEKCLLILTAAALLLSAALALMPERALTVEERFEPLADTPTVPADHELWLDMATSIDLNHATAKELEALPGIGETLARRIVAYRSLHGPFRRVEELMKVEGVHESTLDGILAVATVRK